MDKKNKKIIRIILFSLTVVLLIGISLCCIAQCVPYKPLMLPGLIICGIGIILLIILSMILFIRQGFM